MKIKKGDNVIMLGGKDRGKTGKVLSVSPETGSVVVEGLNMIKRHVRARQQGQKGQIISKERFVKAPGVMVICKSCSKPTRVGYKVDGAGKIRVCKKCSAQL